MADLMWLTKLPNPSFTAAQASSYDRASKPGGDMFANGDAGQFIREETNGGRHEYVMTDLKGPGAVVRIWSANPGGTIRMYFDGETKPRVEFPMRDLLTGKIEPWGDRFAYMASMGCNLYFPFPYSKSLKVTADGETAKHLYYHVNYRTYARNVAVETFEPGQLPPMALPHNTPRQRLHKEFRLNAGQTHTVELERPGGCVRIFRVQVVPPISKVAVDMGRLMREVIVDATFDDEHCVSMPLGDFFASAPGINPVNTLPISISGRELEMRLPMPFEKVARFQFRNTGRIPVSLAVELDSQSFAWDDRSLHLHAQWTAYRGHTRPFRDMTLLDAKGQGMYVGTFMHVANPTSAWWGEGDEKVYIDGESFPSTFGTGTEDYFGYAWSSPRPFERPYHAQPNSGKPGNFGHSSVQRWHLFDPIPYTKSIKFDIELWHWQDVIATYVRGAFWYARPGGSGPVAIDRDLLVPPVLEWGGNVKGAIEGEKLKIVKLTGGSAQIQTDFAELSNGAQLWWIDAKEGDSIELQIPVAVAGNYEVTGAFCFARDYGKHRLTLNGQSAGDIEFFSPTLKWAKRSLGTFKLPKGAVTLKVDCLGHNDKAIPRHMFGLDYLLLKKVK